MDTGKTPAERVQELATLMAKLQSVESDLRGLSNRYSPYESFDQETPEEAAQAEARSTLLGRERDELRSALDALLADTSFETPPERAAWTDALVAVPVDIVPTLVERLLNRPGFDAAVVVPALENTLSSPYGNVRVQAWEWIVKVLGLEPRLKSPDGSFDESTEVELWKSFLRCDLPAFVKIGADGMRGMIRQLQAGATLESLGLAWKSDPAQEVFQRLRSATFERGAAYPVEEVAQLIGYYRYLAEATLAIRVEKGDERAPAALARLGAKWTVPMLEAFAVAPETWRQVREQITESLRVLNG